MFFAACCSATARQRAMTFQQGALRSQELKIDALALTVLA